MADLPYIDATMEVKIAGQDSTGDNVNYAGADANGNLFVKDYSDGPVTPGTAAGSSILIGGQYNSTLPTLTNTQQSAVQVDSNGRLIVRNSEFPATVDTNYGTVGANTIRTASQIGNATGAADFNAGNYTAQTLRVVIATNQPTLSVQTEGVSTVATTTEISVAAKNGTGFTVVYNSFTVLTTSETPVFYLKNPSGSGKTLYIATSFLAPTPATNNWTQFNVYYNPTTTANGTAKTINNRQASSSNTSVASAFTSPTVTANGTLIDCNLTGNNSQDYGNIQALNIDPYYVVPPNNSLLLTATVKTNTTPIIVIFNWFEA